MVTYHNRNTQPAETPFRSFYSARWGRVDSTLMFAIATRSATFRLLVLAPGTTSSERFWVALNSWLYYRGGVVVLALFASIALISTPLNFLASVLTGSAIALMTLAGSWWMARAPLSRAHGVRCRAFAPTRRNDEPRVDGDQQLFEDVYAQLRRLDNARLEPVEYEARWTEVFNLLEQTPTGRDRTKEKR